MLYDLIKEGYGEKQELNCAEKIIYGANEVLYLSMKIKPIKAFEISICHIQNIKMHSEYNV